MKAAIVCALARFPVSLGITSLFTPLLIISPLAAPLPAQTTEPASPTSPPTSKKKLTIDLLLEMETVAAPRVAPDGTQVVFTRTWMDKVNDRPQSELWIMDADGSRLRQLTEGSQPEWSPDGTRIAFVREGKPTSSQIHVLWVATREISQVTRVEESPSGLRWSPDGKRLSFQMVVPEKEDALSITLPKKPEGAKWAEDPKVITRLNYRSDQNGYRPAGWKHLFAVDAAGGMAHQVTSGNFDHDAGEWMPDGKSLVFSGLRTDDADWQIFESDLYQVDVESGAVTALTTRKGSDDNPKVSPDGKHIAWITSPDHDLEKNSYDVSTLMVMDADGKAPRPITAGLDRDPVDVVWSRASDGLFFTLDHEGARDVWFSDLSGNRRPLTHGAQKITLSDVTRDGRAFGVVTAPQQPVDIVSVATRGADTGTLRTLTHVNEDVLAQVDLGAVEEIRYRSADNLEVEGWLVKPPDFDPAKKYPLILQIHGGPHSMFGVEWQFERQLHAAEGFLLLYTNPRGSTGYGQAFGNAIKNAYPGRDYDDLMHGVDAVIAKGCVDERNLFVYGGSGGGVLTAWIVGHTDRFCGAVSMFPVIDWISFVGTTDGPYWYHNFKTLPWEDVKEHWDRSPLKYVGNVKTPTLLITGELDLRTPMSQTEEYYQALKFLKVDTAMIRIQDEYHGAAARHPSNAMRRMLYVQAWFKKHMKKEEPAAPAPTSGS